MSAGPVARRLALALGLALLGIVAALLLAVPRLAESEMVRARIEEAGREVTGREVGYARLGFGWLPPRVSIEGARIAGPTADDPFFLEAGAVDLRLALIPLLRRALVVGSLSIDGATLRVARTEAGFDLPGPDQEVLEPSRPEREGDGDRERGPAITLAVREVALRRGTVRIEDRTVEPAVHWELEDLQVTAEAHSFEAPIDFRAAARIGSGGRLRAEGAAHFPFRRLRSLVVRLRRRCGEAHQPEQQDLRPYERHGPSPRSDGPVSPIPDL